MNSSMGNSDFTVEIQLLKNVKAHNREYIGDSFNNKHSRKHYNTLFQMRKNIGKGRTLYRITNQTPQVTMQGRLNSKRNET